MIPHLLVWSRLLFLSYSLFDHLFHSDPVQLNLLYEQTKEDIKTGAHPVTIEEARKLAAFTVHITYGNHREDKHQPGTIKYGKYSMYKY